MIIFKLDKTLADLGISKYRLSKDTGIAENAIYKICNNKSSQIKLETLDKIMKALKEVNNYIELKDIIEYVEK